MRDQAAGARRRDRENRHVSGRVHGAEPEQGLQRVPISTVVLNTQRVAERRVYNVKQKTAASGQPLVHDGQSWCRASPACSAEPRSTCSFGISAAQHTRSRWSRSSPSIGGREGVRDGADDGHRRPRREDQGGATALNLPLEASRPDATTASDGDRSDGEKSPSGARRSSSCGDDKDHPRTSRIPRIKERSALMPWQRSRASAGRRRPATRQAAAW